MLRAMVVFTLCMCVIAQGARATPPTYSDLKYAGNWNQGLDLYVPSDRLDPCPVLIFVHGGGWLDGDKAQAASIVDALLTRGFAIAAINYRLSYQAHFPAQLYDCKGAIRYLRAHAGQYNIDPTRFATYGESAGGHLAALLATTSGDSSLEGSVGGNTGFSSAVQAFVDVNGPSDLFNAAQFNDSTGNEISQLIGHDIFDIIAHIHAPGYASWVSLVNSANPARHVGGGSPPGYIFQGGQDTLVPPPDANTFAAAMDDAGVPVTLRFMQGVGHDLPESEKPPIWDFLVSQLTPLPQLLAFGGVDPGDGFGQSVAVIGDVNGDGVDDIVVGAPFNDDKGQDAGRVTVHSGTDGSLLRIIRGRHAGDRFGWSVAAAGDVNGDGIGDFIVGSPRADANGGNSGHVDVYAGGTWKRVRSFDGEHAGDQLGYSVAAADVDGDGHDEIICGAPCADLPAGNAGCVLVYSASDGHLVRRIKGGGAGDHFGWSVANAGDVDGDGRDDLVIGAPNADGGGTNSGSVAVWGYDGTNWTRRLQKQGASGEQLGKAVAGAGDVDGDGRADVIAGAPDGVTGGGATGLARVYSIAHNSIIATLQPVGGQEGEQFGSAVAGTGDVNGDGLPDIMVGASRHSQAGPDSGRITVFSGLGAALQVLDGPVAGAKFGQGLAGRADINGDHQPDVVAAATGMFWQGVRGGVVYVLEP